MTSALDVFFCGQLRNKAYCANGNQLAPAVSIFTPVTKPQGDAISNLLRLFTARAGPCRKLSVTNPPPPRCRTNGSETNGMQLVSTA